MPPIPFALHASLGCPSHADLALSLASEFRRVHEDEVEGSLDALATELSVVRGAPARVQLAATHRLMTAFAPAPQSAGPGALFIDVVLDNLEGHPTLLAVIAAEAGRRAGLDFGLVGDGRRHLVAHRDGEEPLAIDVATCAGSEPPAHGRLAWRCAHQVAFAVCGEVVDRARDRGDLTTALRAAELRLALPLDPESLTRMRFELGRLRAQLN